MQVGIQFHTPCRQSSLMSVGCWGDSCVTFGVVESDAKWIGIEFCMVQTSGADSPLWWCDCCTHASVINRFDWGSRDNQPSDLLPSRTEQSHSINHVGENPLKRTINLDNQYHHPLHIDYDLTLPSIPL